MHCADHFPDRKGQLAGSGIDAFFAQAAPVIPTLAGMKFTDYDLLNFGRVARSGHCSVCASRVPSRVAAPSAQPVVQLLVRSVVSVCELLMYLSWCVLVARSWPLLLFFRARFRDASGKSIHSGPERLSGPAWTDTRESAEPATST